MKGKNYSRNNLKENRNKGDTYYTPYGITREFIRATPFLFDRGNNYDYLEPACGRLSPITKEMILQAIPLSRICVKDIVYGDDFLDEKGQFDVVITNPPYSLAKEFIYKAKTVAKEYIAFLLPLTYLQGQERLTHVWQDKTFPLAAVYVLSRYPMLSAELRDDGKFHTGMQAYAWFVWKRTHTGEPVIRWLDVDKYVLRKKDLIND